jgi:hypothetical protein
MLLEALGNVEAVAIERWWEVSQSAFLGLEGRLDASPGGWLPLESQDAFKRCGIRNIETASGEQFYLIRAVYERSEPDAFQVESYGDIVRVNHETTGSPKPVRRSALIVSLPNPPRKVIVNSTSVK